jgi:branched-subunit amino acid transport protein
MNYDTTLWLIFIVLGLATTFPRASFIVLGNRFSLPPTLQRALRYAPAAALAAIVVPDVLVIGGNVDPLNPKLAAGIAAILVAARWRNPWLPFIVGMAVLVGIKALLPGQG